jgi:hypothetical protein
VAVVLAAVALAVVPFPGLARAAGTPAAVRQAPIDDVVDDVADEVADDATADDEDAVEDDDAAPDDSDLGDDDLTDDLGDEEDVEEIVPVAIDRRGRAVSSPRAFVASRTARGGALRWKSWGSATATGTGRLVFRTAGRKAQAVKGTGTVRLSRLLTCEDGTAVYRRATLAVPHRGRLVVSLPGCPASR